MAQYVYSNSYENRFWLQIMGDNALIIRDRLIDAGPEKQQAKQFFSTFEELLTLARQNQSPEQILQLNRDASKTTQDFRSLLLAILKRQVTQQVTVFLKLDFITIMVSMTNIYLFLLNTFLNNKQPKFVPINQDIFWLPVLHVESVFITENVGRLEEDLRQKAISYMNTFASFSEFAFTLQQIYQIGTTDFPISNHYRANILETLNSFAVFTVDLIGLARQKKLGGTLTVLDLDHIYRKLCYYTTQLSIIQNVPKPVCDPTSNRLLS
jgi:hypothetical protein